MFNHQDNDYGAEGGDESGYDETFDAGYSLSGSLKGVLTAGLILATGAVGCADNSSQIDSMTYDEAQEHLVQLRTRTTASYKFGKMTDSKEEEYDFYYFDGTYKELGGVRDQDVEDVDGQEVIYQGKDGWKEVDGVQELLFVRGQESALAIIDEETALQIERIEADDGYFMAEWIDPDKYSEEETRDLPNVDDGLE